MMTSWITGFPDSDPEILTEALLGEVEGLQDVTPAEVERVQTLAETQLYHQMASLARRADLLSMHQLLFGDARRIHTERDRIRAVTADQIRTFAAETLVPKIAPCSPTFPESAS
jgi:predicted Zn-dependent peptidase